MCELTCANYVREYVCVRARVCVEAFRTCGTCLLLEISGASCVWVCACEKQQRRARVCERVQLYLKCDAADQHNDGVL